MLKKISLRTLCEEFHKTDIQDICLRFPDATHLVLFRNLQMDSSEFGNVSVLAVGPSNSFKTIAQCERAWLKDLPSQRQYPQEYVEIKAHKDSANI